MLVNKVKLINFRNFKEKEISFSPRKNLLFGRNGSGKTSVLEALFLIAFGKSFLGVPKQELIHDGQEEFSVRAELHQRRSHHIVTGSYGRAFRLNLNDQPTTIAELNDYFYPVFFSTLHQHPHSESRTSLRRMMDRFIFGVCALYLHYILRYNKALKQKNYLLKNSHRQVIQAEMGSWNKILAETGVKIVENRMSFIDKLNKEIESGFGGEVTLSYLPSLKFNALNAPAFLAAFEEMRDRESESRMALTGPQRDRYEIRISGKNLDHFSSGEKKKYLLMTYIAFIELFRKEKNEYPPLLIDDYDAAIDELNLDFLINHFPQMQIIATSVLNNDKFDQCIELAKGA